MFLSLADGKMLTQLPETHAGRHPERALDQGSHAPVPARVFLPSMQAESLSRFQPGPWASSLLIQMLLDYSTHARYRDAGPSSGSSWPLLLMAARRTRRKAVSPVFLYYGRLAEVRV